MGKALKRLWDDETGPTAVEYALMIGGMALLILGAVYFFGARVNDSLSNSASSLAKSY